MLEGRKIKDTPGTIPLQNVVVTERASKEAAQLGYSKEKGEINPNKENQPL